ncbi:MAG: tetratricopeptide repeat protein [Thermoanaerobaculaceae bacterium]|nr:tetratricopeptide repeat protein [Thermoanaerobaculaceae bacterium]
MRKKIFFFLLIFFVLAINLFGQDNLKQDKKYEKAKMVFNLGQENFSCGRVEKAKSLFKKAIKIYPELKEAYNNLGILLKEEGDIKEAIECYKKAIEIDNQYFIAYFNLGVLFFEQKRFEDAEKCYKSALLINPSFAPVHYNLGLLYDEIKDYEKAIQSYIEAGKIDRKMKDAFFNLALDYSKLGELDSGVAVLHYISTDVESDPIVFYALSKEYYDEPYHEFNWGKVLDPNCIGANQLKKENEESNE